MQPLRSSTNAGAEAASLESVRLRRAELRETLMGLEISLAAPALGREELWGVAVRDSIAALVSDFAEHVRVTEGPDGLHQAIVAAEPRLSNGVRQLTAEHSTIATELAEITAIAVAPLAVTEVAIVRSKANRVLGELVRHRQRGADLIYDAYETDIGGGD